MKGFSSNSSPSFETEIGGEYWIKWTSIQSPHCTTLFECVTMRGHEIHKALELGDVRK